MSMRKVINGTDGRRWPLEGRHRGPLTLEYLGDKESDQQRIAAKPFGGNGS